jgi:hypothetical protein
MNLTPKYEVLLICSFEDRQTFRKTGKQHCNHIYNLSIFSTIPKTRCQHVLAMYSESKDKLCINIIQ